MNDENSLECLACSRETKTTISVSELKKVTRIYTELTAINVIESDFKSLILKLITLNQF